MRKFADAHRLLLAGADLAESDFVMVEPASRERIERVHLSSYLDDLCTGRMEPQAAMKLGLPPCAALFERSAREVEGTRLAAWCALENGIAANLAGGTHHAFPDHGEGFCVMNDVAITIHDVHTFHPDLRILVADTDAHQGNGTHKIFADDPRVFTYSIHVGRNYPSRKVAGTLDVPLDRYVSGNVFLDALANTLPRAMDAFRPELVFWISGADLHRNDRFGQMNLSVADMHLRDQRVTEWALERGIPLVVLYGGGYNREVENTARLHRNTIATSARMARRFGKGI